MTESGTLQPAREMPEVTVILLIRDPGSWELETPSLVRSQRYPGRVFVHVVDSSPDPNAEASRAFRDGADSWQAVAPESFHHGTTRNLALRSCKTPVVVFLSADAHPVGARWLEFLVRPIAHGDADVSYGRQRSPNPDPEREASFGWLYPDRPEIKTKERIAELGIRGLHFSDVSSAYRTEVLQAVPFPENIAIFQDAAIAKLMLDAGYRIAYEPDSIVLHAHPLTLRSMWDRFRGLGEVYERLGFFAELKAAKGRSSIITEGLKAVKGTVPRLGRNPVQGFRSLAMAAVKAAAVAQGRRDAKRRGPLTFQWTPEGGSRALRQ